VKRISCLVAFLLCAESPARRAIPHRAVKVVVPWPPGQRPTFSARIVAQKLQEALGQPFVIDNRPGAGGAIRLRRGRQSPPDGYTLLASSSGPISIMPNVGRRRLHDPLKDFAAVKPDRGGALRAGDASSFPRRTQENSSRTCARTGQVTRSSSSGTGATAHH